MITISKYEEKNGVVEMSLFISNPYSGNSQTRHETFTTAEQAQNHYWQLVYSYFNYGIEQFVEHCKSIAENYFCPTTIPFYNNANWRLNYWTLLKKFNTDYFGGIIDTTDQKAKYILENKQILIDAITIYNDAGHYQAKTMITELITLSNGVIKDLEKKNETINKTNLKTA